MRSCEPLLYPAGVETAAPAADWASLAHAYGPAIDTPEHLSHLRSDDAVVRERAWWDLIGSANHQGNLYTVTPWIVGPLIDLAIDPEYPDRLQATAHATLIVEGLVYHLDDPVEHPGQISDADTSKGSEKAGLLIECRRMAAERADDVARLVHVDDPRIRRWALRLSGVVARFERGEIAQFEEALSDPDPLTRAVALWQLMISSPDRARVSKCADRLIEDAGRDALDHFVAHVVHLADRHMPRESAREIVHLRDAVWDDFEKADLHHVAESPIAFAAVLSGVGSEMEVEALAH